MSKNAKEQKRDPFWLLLMLILILFTVLLMVERVRIAVLLVIGIVLCYLLYRNPIGTKPSTSGKSHAL
jgi:chromate transport protein ChrA